MTDTLFSLAYVSRSTLSSGQSEIDAQIAAILQSARRNNQRLKVTGALLFTEGSFAQVLEGPQAAVEEIFEAIECDLRHNRVTMLHFHAVEGRSFADWDMAYAGAGLASPSGIPATAAMALPTGQQGFIDVLHDQVTRAEAARRCLAAEPHTSGWVRPGCHG